MCYSTNTTAAIAGTRKTQPLMPWVGSAPLVGGRAASWCSSVTCCRAACWCAAVTCCRATFHGTLPSRVAEQRVMVSCRHVLQIRVRVGELPSRFAEGVGKPSVFSPSNLYLHNNARKRNGKIK